MVDDDNSDSQGNDAVGRVGFYAQLGPKPALWGLGIPAVGSSRCGALAVSVRSQCRVG